MSTEMKGKRVVVTGASRGIGRETALALGRMGADLSLVVRDAGRGRAVADEVRALGANGDVDVFVADLSSMADIRRVAAEFLAKHDRLDVLVNNAGALFMERQVTKDGYELTFATNHLGYFLLTELLLDAVKKAPAGRIVNVASEAHHRGTFDFDDLMGEKSYAGFAPTARRSSPTSSSRASWRGGSKEPASRRTRFIRASSPRGSRSTTRASSGTVWKLASPFLMSSENGAKTTLFLATDPSVARVSGKYFSKCKVKTPSREAREASVAKRLWDVSEELVRAGKAS